ncbi:hypothetical protein FACS1894151_09060 [Spirochaetia bacterium]|nr:hypothetical protein FACS1894151_09060 [Spirochaetia bacterium]
MLWSIMPEINMKKLPLLGSVFSLLKGSFSMDSNSDGFSPSYQAQLLFSNMTIGQSVVSLAAVTGSDWYNSDAKYTVYGGRLGVLGRTCVLVGIKPTIVIEGGYRSFFDVVAANPSYYKNGPYGTLFLGMTLDADTIFATVGLMFESNPQFWPLPRIGVFIAYGKPKAKVYFGNIDNDRVSDGGFTLIGYDFLYLAATGG